MATIEKLSDTDLILLLRADVIRLTHENERLTDQLKQAREIMRFLLAYHSGYPLCRCKGCCRTRIFLGHPLGSSLEPDEAFLERTRRRDEARRKE